MSNSKKSMTETTHYLLLETIEQFDEIKHREKLTTMIYVGIAEKQ